MTLAPSQSDTHVGFSSPDHNTHSAYDQGLRRTQRPRYPLPMTNEERLERYLEFCRRIYERMKREGVWPWSEAKQPRRPDNV